MEVHCLHSLPLPPDNMIGPVYRLMPHPQHSHLLLSAVEGNNEVSAWNMETGQKKIMLWGVSQAPPFSRSSKVRENPLVLSITSFSWVGDVIMVCAVCRSVATQA